MCFKTDIIIGFISVYKSSFNLSIVLICASYAVSLFDIIYNIPNTIFINSILLFSVCKKFVLIIKFNFEFIIGINNCNIAVRCCISLLQISINDVITPTVSTAIDAHFFILSNVAAFISL